MYDWLDFYTLNLLKFLQKDIGYICINWLLHIFTWEGGKELGTILPSLSIKIWW